MRLLVALCLLFLSSTAEYLAGSDQQQQRDVTLGPPSASILCAVGIRVGQNLTSAVSQTCDGYCATMTTSVNSVQVDIFSCAPWWVATTLNLTASGCTFLTTDDPISVCFCGTVASSLFSCMICSRTAMPTVQS